MSFQKASIRSKLLHQLCSLHGKDTGKVRTGRSYQLHSFLVHKFRRNFNRKCGLDFSALCCSTGKVIRVTYAPAPYREGSAHLYAIFFWHIGPTPITYPIIGVTLTMIMCVLC